MIQSPRITLQLLFAASTLPHLPPCHPRETISLSTFPSTLVLRKPLFLGGKVVYYLFFSFLAIRPRSTSSSGLASFGRLARRRALSSTSPFSIQGRQTLANALSRTHVALPPPLAGHIPRAQPGPANCASVVNRLLHMVCPGTQSASFGCGDWCGERGTAVERGSSLPPCDAQDVIEPCYKSQFGAGGQRKKETEKDRLSPTNDRWTLFGDESGACCANPSRQS